MEHFLCHCPTLNGIRTAKFGSPNMHVLSELSDIDIRAINSFIHASGWFDSNVVSDM